MKVLPDYLLPDDNATPDSERKIHELLKCSKIEGYALHSLNIASSRHPADLEADFVLIGDFGLMVLEVKGGQVSVRNGDWTTKNSRGTHAIKQSPFNQAKRACHELHTFLKDRGVPFSYRYGHAVVLPGTKSLPDSPEYQPEQWCGIEACSTAKHFDSWLKDLFEYLRRRSKAAGDLSQAEVESLKKTLRPSFESSVPLGQYAVQIQHQIRQFSEEQFEAIDEIEENDRILCRGGAGTGKTFILVELAKRELSSGKSVMVTAESQPLLNSIREQLSHPNWTDQLAVVSPEVLEAGEIQSVDVAFVDEGQDLLRIEFLDALDQAVVGGLDSGRWRWFMDDQNQAGYAQSDPEALELLQQKGVTRKRLLKNCRNTADIVQRTQQVTGADIGKTQVEGRGIPVLTTWVGSEAEQVKKVKALITDWRRDSDVLHEEIVVLVMTSAEREVLRSDLPDRVNVQPVKDFKGLESDFIILAGFWDQDRVLESWVRDCYTGMTRARVGLHMVLPEYLKPTVTEPMLRNMSAT